MNNRLLQVRDVFAMRAHFGWAHVLLERVSRLGVTGKLGMRPAIRSVLTAMDRRTQRSSIEFDSRFGTDTFGRFDVKISDDPADGARWGYSPINQDFFREIMKSIPNPLSPYTFVDVGSGKGAAVLLASEFPFRKLVGVELTAELVEVARANTERYCQRSGRSIGPEWIQTDFFRWEIPAEPQLFFLNNPFPEALTLEAIQTLERSLSTHPRPLLLVFRKAPKSTGDHLRASPLWQPLRLAPYWRVYRAG